MRNIAVQPPFIPPRAGTLMRAFVDARGKPYTWSIRRLGQPGVIRGSGRKTKFALNIHAPRGASGVYLLSARRGSHVTQVPLPVQAPGHQPVLVVLPYMTWQGRNPVDDDGDGMPNLLDLGIGVHVPRPFAGGGLPAGFLHFEAPTISWLDHTHRRYDITTDLALALLLTIDRIPFLYPGDEAAQDYREVGALFAGNQPNPVDLAWVKKLGVKL